MCGLVFSTRTQAADSSRWLRARALLECRGPDAQTATLTSAYAAGHTRLAVIGLGEAGRQPYTADQESDVLVFNGEIYNYREIARTLGIEARSDTQVLYELLRAGHTDRVSELRGMYAFVYWRRQPEMIVTGRDVFGIKPLYLMHGADGSLSFSSVPSALAAISPTTEPDAVAIAGFLATGYFPAGASVFRGISKCPAGAVTTWTRAGTGWEPSTQTIDLGRWPVLPCSDAVEDSVRAHLVSDVPVGVLLSGGLDSTLIAATAARQVSGLRSYSLTNPENPEIDESEYARWNSAQIGSRHVEVPFKPSASLEIIRSLVMSTGEPFGDAAYVPLAVLCERAAQDVKVVLAGEGADELFAGYRRYEVERWRNHWIAGRALGAVARLRGSRKAYLETEPTQRSRAWAHWAESDDYRAHAYLLSSEWDAVVSAFPVAGPRALAERRNSWLRLRSKPSALGLPPNRAFDLTEWLPNVFLEKSDRASMLHGLEVRVPYLDPVVARSAAAVIPSGTSKEPLRSALRELIPTVRLPKRKMGLSVDVPGMINGSGLQEYASFALNDPRSLLRSVDGPPDLLRSRVLLSPTLAFRVAVLAVWQQEWLPSGIT